MASAEQGAIIFAFFGRGVDLEDDLAVIIEASDEGIVDFIIDFLIGDDGKGLVEAFAGFLGKEIFHLGGVFDDFLIFGDFAIEDAHGVEEQALLAILAHRVDAGSEIFLQRLFVGIPGLLIAQGVDLDLEVLEPEIA